MWLSSHRNFVIFHCFTSVFGVEYWQRMSVVDWLPVLDFLSHDLNSSHSGYFHWGRDYPSRDGKSPDWEWRTGTGSPFTIHMSPNSILTTHDIQYLITISLLGAFAADFLVCPSPVPLLGRHIYSMRSPVPVSAHGCPNTSSVTCRTHSGLCEQRPVTRGHTFVRQLARKGSNRRTAGPWCRRVSRQGCLVRPYWARLTSRTNPWLQERRWVWLPQYSTAVVVAAENRDTAKHSMRGLNYPKLYANLKGHQVQQLSMIWCKV